MTKNITKKIFFLGLAIIKLQESAGAFAGGIDSFGELESLQGFGQSSPFGQKATSADSVEKIYKESFAININHNCATNIGTVTLSAQKHDLDTSDAELRMGKFLIKKHTEEQADAGEKCFFIHYHVFSLHGDGEPVFLRQMSFGPVFKTK